MTFLTQLGLTATRWRHRHARAATAALLASLGGFGVLAFAVAPLAPDASMLPQVSVTLEVPTESVGAQLEALAGQNLALTRSATTRAGDAAEPLLRRLGVTDPGTWETVRKEASAKGALDGRPGRLVQVRANERGQLLELVVRSAADNTDLGRTHFNRVTLAPDAAGVWQLRRDSVPFSSQTRLASGTIRSSLFAATDEAGIPDPVASQMAEIFSVDIDFHRELRKGDTFSVVYETLTADGEPVPWNQGAGRVLAAEFVNGGKAHQAIWFEAGGKGGAYFDPSGKSRKRVFLASPMEFSRVTSGFAMRMHPILQQMRAHLGVDYAAPKGTPVRAVGEGVVEFAGWQGGYGNVVKIRHGNERSTVYAHLSAIDVRKGQRVEQGARVGAVGATGWATGPHLHFEFQVRGQHQDPLKVAKASETVALDAASRPKFSELASRVQAKLDIAETVGAQRARFE